jgi:hypothetical protein
MDNKRFNDKVCSSIGLSHLSMILVHDIENEKLSINTTTEFVDFFNNESKFYENKACIFFLINYVVAMIEDHAVVLRAEHINLYIINIINTKIKNYIICNADTKYDYYFSFITGANSVVLQLNNFSNNTSIKKIKKLLITTQYLCIIDQNSTDELIDSTLIYINKILSNNENIRTLVLPKLLYSNHIKQILDRLKSLYVIDCIDQENLSKLFELISNSSIESLYLQHNFVGLSASQIVKLLDTNYTITNLHIDPTECENIDCENFVDRNYQISRNKLFFMTKCPAPI